MAIPGASAGHIYNGATPINVTEWSASWTGRGAEVTTSGNTCAQYAPTIIDPSWTASFPMDDPNFPEVIGLVANTNPANAFYFKHGNSTKADKLVGTYIESVQKSSNSNSDVPRVVVTGKGGTLTTNVTAGTG